MAKFLYPHARTTSLAFFLLGLSACGGPAEAPAEGNIIPDNQLRTIEAQAKMGDPDSIDKIVMHYNLKNRKEESSKWQEVGLKYKIPKYLYNKSKYLLDESDKLNGCEESKRGLFMALQYASLSYSRSKDAFYKESAMELYFSINEKILEKCLVRGR